MGKTNLLLIGSGGREHALAWKLSQSANLNKLYIAPGNPGTQVLGENLPLNPLDFEAVKRVIIEKNIDLVVVGPEEPLVRGLHDFIASDSQINNVAVIGPKQNGAMLEGSKDFAKAFMCRHNIPTARYATFDASTAVEAKQFLKSLKPPFVLKADGLAAGKGVVIEPSYEVACAVLDEFFAGKFGEASKKVVIEEFLDGIEVSVFVLTDGSSYVILPEAKDYKRIGVGNTGLNTGGMGAVSPVPFADKVFMQKVEERIVKPTIEGLVADNIPYVGFVFIGLMNVGGEPFVIEYNVRMGDPETEVVMPRIKSDLLELFERCGARKLAGSTVEFDSNTATTVVLVSGGYPESYQKGKIITGIEELQNSMVFHAGTSINDGNLVTSGGRVLACTALGCDRASALEKSFELAQKISFDGKYFRSDIGGDL